MSIDEVPGRMPGTSARIGQAKTYTSFSKRKFILIGVYCTPKLECYLWRKIRAVLFREIKEI